MVNILQKLNEDNFGLVPETPYIFGNRFVPRVTSILSSMLSEEYLMGWANYLGFKRQNYKSVVEEAAQKGSYTHESIENYITNGIEPNTGTLPVQFRTAVQNAYDSFKLWWDIVTKNKYKVIYQEFPLVCEWFGGTLDLLMEINDKVYLFDFKTSNHPSYKYFIQLSAYIYMLKILYNIEVDGCAIIMLDKTQVHFNEIMIDLSDDSDKSFMDHCRETFFALVYGYYNRLQVEQEFKEVLKRVNLEG